MEGDRRTWVFNRGLDELMQVKVVSMLGETEGDINVESSK